MTSPIIPTTFSSLTKIHLSKKLIQFNDDFEWARKSKSTQELVDKSMSECQTVINAIKNDFTAILTSMTPTPPHKIINSGEMLSFLISYNTSPVLYQEKFLYISKIQPLFASSIKPQINQIKSYFDSLNINIISKIRNFYHEVKFYYDQFYFTGWSYIIERSPEKLYASENFLIKLMQTCKTTLQDFKNQTLNEYKTIKETFEFNGQFPTPQQLKTALYFKLPLTKINLEETSIKPFHENIFYIKNKILQFESANIDQQKEILLEIILICQNLENSLLNYQCELLKSLLFLKFSNISLRTNELIHLALYFHLIQQTNYWLNFISWLLNEIDSKN